MTDYNEVVLANIGDGTMDEKFAKAMKDITANIQDTNTPAEARRGITIDISIVPDENRESAAIAIDFKLKLAPQKRKTSLIHFVVDRHTARHKAVTQAFHQRELFEVKDAADEQARASEAPTKPPAA